MFKIFAIASSLAFMACTTPKTDPLADCVEVVKSWGAVNAQPLNDGGIVAVRAGPDGKVDLLVIVSDKQAGEVLQGIGGATGITLAGEAGKCAHPQSGYAYNVIPLQKTEAGDSL